MYCSAEYNSPVGKITLLAKGGNIAGAYIGGQEHCYFPAEIAEGDLPALKKAAGWFDSYFSGKKPNISELPIVLEGSEFQRTVWKILCEIPYGETVTYGEIAKEIARIQGKERMSAQAVGGAVGSNPISVIIPCHRVLGANRKLTGYNGGIDKKAWLLTHEGAFFKK